MTLPGVRIASVMIDAHRLSLDITSNTTTLTDEDESNRLLGAKSSLLQPATAVTLAQAGTFGRST
jgi:hypothetical protein